MKKKKSIYDIILVIYGKCVLSFKAAEEVQEEVFVEHYDEEAGEEKPMEEETTEEVRRGLETVRYMCKLCMFFWYRCKKCDNEF